MDHVGVANGPIANEKNGIERSGFTPTGERRGRRISRMLLQGGVPVGLVQRGKDFSTLRVHPGRDESLIRRHVTDGARERFERGYGHDVPAEGCRETLDGRDADSQSGKRARPRRDREQLDVVNLQRGRIQDRHNVTGKPLTVRSRRIALPFAADDAVTHKGDASSARRRVQGQNQHGISMLYSQDRTSLRDA